ncbi:MAG TPA: TetR/AcrR family transcriptional regulator [Longimicrobium sp.]|jgi:AcrR family transcriptional regulator|uniref:TetR/AcrR family transcriptional regulator n=1 Tax=Longimicrobium sp. TaxID=2029185 RepID=UPI002ED90A2C
MTVRAPRQARSSEGLERILLAAEEVFAEKEFSAATLAEIASRAGYTVGAFYARFSNKAALLKTLEDRIYRTVEQVLDARTASLATGQETPGEFLRAAVEDSVTVYRRHRGALRALVAQAREDGELRERMRRVNATTIERFAGALRAHPGSVRHPDPEAAVEFALVLIGSTLRQTILFSDTWTVPRRIDDATLARELSRSVITYLGLPQ